MENANRGILRPAAGVVWRRQRVLWWLFVLNLAIMLLGGASFSQRLGALDYSLEAQRLVRGMDLGVFLEVLSRPGVGSGALSGGVALAQLVYFVLVLFLTGGILTAYAADRRLSTAEFFQGCGAYFWRFVRLLIMMLIVLIPVYLIFNLWNWIAGKLATGAYSDRNSALLSMAGVGLLLLLFVIVRLWFDMAQVRAVIEDERRMLRTAGRAFRQTFGHFGQLFWLFVRPLLFGAVAFVVAGWLWTRIPAHRFGVSFVLWELVILFWIAMRLWQRAGEVVWYQRHRVVEPAPVAVPAPPVEILTPAADSAGRS